MNGELSALSKFTQIGILEKYQDRKIEDANPDLPNLYHQEDKTGFFGEKRSSC